MGKMSEIAMLLDDQAAELGFESYEDAIERGGYEIDYENARLWKPLEELDNAHQAWLKEKEEVLGELISVYNDIDIPRDLKKYIKHAIEFIKQGEC